MLKSLDWGKFTVDVVEVAVHSDAEHDAITLFLETQVKPVNVSAALTHFASQLRSLTALHGGSLHLHVAYQAT